MNATNFFVIIALTTKIVRRQNTYIDNSFFRPPLLTSMHYSCLPNDRTNNNTACFDIKTLIEKNISSLGKERLYFYPTDGSLLKMF